MKKQVCINIEPDLLEKIDSIRGEVPRCRVVEKILKEAYRDQNKNAAGLKSANQSARRTVQSTTRGVKDND